VNEGLKVANEILHKKEGRQSLSKESLAGLYEKATKTVHCKYDLIPLTLSDKDKLNDTYNLQIQARTKHKDTAEASSSRKLRTLHF
jgi:hypothetical protein